MSDLIDVVNLDKDHLLDESSVFCMFPWTHLNTTPKGDVYPCCSNNYTEPFANTKEVSLKEAFNSEGMKELRRNMLSGTPSKICEFCYKHEQHSPHSFRRYSIDNFSQYFDDVMAVTHEDGTVDDFKMRYFDIRFSNICNFKCRTCGTEFSSQWALEDRKTFNPDGPMIIHVDDEKGNVLEEVLEHVDHIDLAYFAGGEPLITPEHYVILEELIRKGRTDITLRYNTNASTLKYKDYDIINLWKHFKKVEVSCSIDHYGERAELMRHGTDWGKVENNLREFRKLRHVDFQINTVLSVFNYLTLQEFYDYMMDSRLILNHMDWYHSLYQAVNPPHYCAKALPEPMKAEGTRKIQDRFISSMCVDRLAREAAVFANEEHTWDIVKQDFFHHTERLNDIRREDLFTVFPELQPLQDYQ